MEDHDQRFKNLLELCLAEFIDLFFPQWSDRFDWQGVEFPNREAFVDPPKGSRKFLDLIAKVPIKRPHQVSLRSETHFVILIHIEIESAESVATFHPRMFDYFSWLRTKYQLPVLPIGLFLRVGLDGAGWIAYEESLWEEKLVQFRYPYIGLPKLSAQHYVSGTNLLGVALAALMNVSDSERAKLKADALQRLATAPVSAERRSLLCECVDAYLKLDKPAMADFEHLLQTPQYREADMVSKSTREIGRDEGRIEGRIEGSVKTQLRILTRQLERRFGALDSESLRRLEEMSIEERDQLAEDLVDAASLEQLGLSSIVKST